MTTKTPEGCTHDCAVCLDCGIAHVCRGDAALRARVAAAEAGCDELAAYAVEIGKVLDAEDEETPMEAAKRVMRKLEAATNLIAHTAARVAELEQQVAAQKAALSEMLALYPSPKDCEAIAPRKKSKIVFGFRQYTGKSLTDKKIIEIHSLLGGT